MSRLYVPLDSQQKKVILLSSMNHAHEFNSKRVFFFLQLHVPLSWRIWECACSKSKTAASLAKASKIALLPLAYE
jgi:hypothetical protein